MPETPISDSLKADLQRIARDSIRKQRQSGRDGVGLLNLITESLDAVVTAVEHLEARAAATQPQQPPS